MEQTLTKEQNKEEENELQAAIQQIFEEIELVNVRIKRDQAEIDRLKAETRAILNQLKAA